MTDTTQSVWDSHPDICNTLADLWSTNSARQCAEKLGEQFGVVLTRQAVIGKAHRMGLGGTAKLFMKTVQPVAPFVEPALPEPELPSLELTLDELTQNNCRFIAGDDPREARYCGHTVFRRSMCKTHFALCYQEPRR